MFFPIYNKESAVQGFIFLCILKAHLYMDEHALFINRRDLLLPFIHMQTFSHVICMQNGHITTTTCWKFFIFSGVRAGYLKPRFVYICIILWQWLRRWGFSVLFPWLGGSIFTNCPGFLTLAIRIFW